MEDKIQAFRQPMVTATGIILGFILSFATSFVKTDNHYSDLLAYIIWFCILIGIGSLINVLSRILRMNYPRDRGERYYNRTLQYFIFGVSIAFVGVLIDMFGSFMVE